MNVGKDSAHMCRRQRPGTEQTHPMSSHGRRQAQQQAAQHRPQQPNAFATHNHVLRDEGGADLQHRQGAGGAAKLGAGQTDKLSNGWRFPLCLAFSCCNQALTDRLQETRFARASPRPSAARQLTATSSPCLVVTEVGVLRSRTFSLSNVILCNRSRRGDASRGERQTAAVCISLGERPRPDAPAGMQRRLPASLGLRPSFQPYPGLPEDVDGVRPARNLPGAQVDALWHQPLLQCVRHAARQGEGVMQSWGGSARKVLQDKGFHSGCLHSGVPVEASKSTAGKHMHGAQTNPLPQGSTAHLKPRSDSTSIRMSTACGCVRSSGDCVRYSAAPARLLCLSTGITSESISLGEIGEGGWEEWSANTA